MMDHCGGVRDKMWVSMMKHKTETLKIINHGAWGMKCCGSSRVMKFFNFHSHRHMCRRTNEHTHADGAGGKGISRKFH